MALQPGPHVRPHAPLATWLVAAALGLLGLALALAFVVAAVTAMTPFALVALLGLVGSVGGFWSVLARRG